MFNDLNNQNNATKAAVDDIFAETDKHPDTNYATTGGVDIEAHRVGVVTQNEGDLNADVPNAEKSGKLFKIIIILVIVAILGVLGFIVYTKFLSGKADTSDTSTPVAVNTETETPVATQPEAVTVNPTPVAVPEISGSTSTADTSIISIDDTASSTIIAVPIDTDSDSLTDDEEKLAGTNINLVDTDSDSLSDYEEVKIYKTDPLSSDTDGDGYTDGAEVKSGYNPNGAGKLSGAVKPKQ